MNLSGIWNNLSGVLGSQQTDKSSGPGVNQSGGTGPEHVSPNGGKTDHADLSGSGLAVAQSAKQSAASDVRMDKVNSVRAAIANGTYQVSAQDVADKVIQSLLD